MHIYIYLSWKFTGNLIYTRCIYDNMFQTTHRYYNIYSLTCYSIDKLFSVYNNTISIKFAFMFKKERKGLFS